LLLFIELQEEKEKQALEYKCQQQCLEKGDQEGSAESDLLGERSSVLYYL
jgi:hypothetical protein